METYNNIKVMDGGVYILIEIANTLDHICLSM